MSTVYEIPTVASPQQLTISLAGTTYQLTLIYRDTVVGSASADQLGWVLDIADSSGDLILSGVPLVTGADLLAQYDYLDFGGSLYAQLDGGTLAPPDFAGMGTTGHLYFVTTP